MNDPLVSIIIPIYNVEEYLCSCLDSIINQKCDNFEVILVNDGSKDASGKICDEYALKDNRFIVFHKENSGPGAARNFGITQARGKYITFVDSDDWIENDYVERIMNEMHSDLLYFGMRALMENHEPYNYIMPNIVDIGGLEDNLYSMLIRQNNYYDFVMVANKCFVKEIIDKNNIIFPTDILHSEDEIFTLRYFLCIRSFQCINDILYNYNQRYSSSSIPILPNESYRICQYQYSISEKFETQNMRGFVKTRWLYFFYLNYIRNKGYSNEIIKKLKSLIKKSDIKYLSITFKSSRNNPNFYPSTKFVAFTRDILFLDKFGLFFLFSDLLISLRDSLHEKWLLFKYEFSSKLLRRRLS